MPIVQIIEMKTSRLDELDALIEGLQSNRERAGRPTRAMTCTDRDRPGYVVSIVEFPSEEAVAASNNDPVVKQAAEKMAALCDGPPKFYNLEVHRTMD